MPHPCTRGMLASTLRGHALNQPIPFLCPARSANPTGSDICAETAWVLKGSSVLRQCLSRSPHVTMGTLRHGEGQELARATEPSWGRARLQSGWGSLPRSSTVPLQGQCCCWPAPLHSPLQEGGDEGLLHPSMLFRHPRLLGHCQENRVSHRNDGPQP